jgi:IS66 C-terminal element/Transposase IS66 family
MGTRVARHKEHIQLAACWAHARRKFYQAHEQDPLMAILYTIVESCRRRGLDPQAYLRHVLARLPSATNWQIGELTPQGWAKQTQ